MLRIGDNAIKFTKEGEITISVAKEAEQEKSFLLRFSVRDTGVGIPSNYMKNLFQDFTQADSSLTRKYEGMGMGLTMVRRLITVMGGKIWVESVEGEGTCFHFTLPFRHWWK